TVDATGSVGGYTSLQLTTRGYLMIAYLDFTNSDLKLASVGYAAPAEAVPALSSHVLLGLLMGLVLLAGRAGLLATREPK
ncbi:MAG: hypothetical protein RLZZ502_864, partial [Pseudomonadota bacterium]